MICASCNEPVRPASGPIVAPGVSPGVRCPACGESPYLDGRYRLDAVLGTGSSGTTHRATSADGVFAVKEIPLRATSPKARELAEREARVLSELDHPGVPRYREAIVAGTGRGRALWLVQEHVDGVDLHAELQRHRYAEGEVLDVLDELLGILAYLHSRTPPVVHRDVKPKNVMRRKDGRLVLVDFGAVRDALKGELGGSTVAGTFGYMAPEQFHGDATPATDVYGVGALAVALLTRKEPHTLLQGTKLAWEPHADVSPGTRRLLDDLLADDPRRRPKDAAEARERLRASRGSLQAVPREPRLAPLVPAWIGVLGPSLALGTAVIAVPAVGIAAGTLWTTPAAPAALHLPEAPRSAVDEEIARGSPSTDDPDLLERLCMQSWFARHNGDPGLPAMEQMQDLDVSFRSLAAGDVETMACLAQADAMRSADESARRSLEYAIRKTSGGEVELVDGQPVRATDDTSVRDGYQADPAIRDCLARYEANHPGSAGSSVRVLHERAAERFYVDGADDGTDACLTDAFSSHPASGGLVFVDLRLP